MSNTNFIIGIILYLSLWYTFVFVIINPLVDTTMQISTPQFNTLTDFGKNLSATDEPSVLSTGLSNAWNGVKKFFGLISGITTPAIQDSPSWFIVILGFWNTLLIALGLWLVLGLIRGGGA